jgi:hypothetical protein
MSTKMYLGDGLYATFDGYHIKLMANGDGVHTPASDTVALEPGVYDSLVEWVNLGYPDYNTGRTFKETMDAPPTLSG